MNTLRVKFDSLKRENWSDQEVKNVKLIIDFVQHLMNDHDFNYVAENFGNQAYVQHNRNISDGMDALIEYVKGFANRYPDYTYDVKHIYADGDFVIFHSHATINAKHRGDDGKGLNIMDTWRIKDGQIIAHWDALQPMDGFMRFFNLLTGGKIRNTNGVY
ncbi:MAG: nuclear transport factor 2 family protein [Bacteroidota bacterium]